MQLKSAFTIASLYETCAYILHTACSYMCVQLHARIDRVSCLAKLNGYRFKFCNCCSFGYCAAAVLHSSTDAIASRIPSMYAGCHATYANGLLLAACSERMKAVYDTSSLHKQRVSVFTCMPVMKTRSIASLHG